MSLDAVLSHVRITQAWRALGGPELRRTGQQKYRGAAWYRRGDGLSVALDDSRGVWRDHVEGTGGGVLDLVVRVRGGNRQDALRFLAHYAGIPLTTHARSSAERSKWAQQRRGIERDLPEARYWRQAALELGEDVLDRLKRALCNPDLPQPNVREISWWWHQLDHWRKMDTGALVTEYRCWRAHYEGLTRDMVWAAQVRERFEFRALIAYLRLTERESGRA